MPAHFGLDIGSGFVKIVDINGNNLVAAMAPNPCNKVGLDLSAADRLTLIDVLKKLMKDVGIGKDQVVISTPEQMVFSRSLELPIMSDPELATAVKWELDQVSPYPVADMEYSWVVMSRPKRVTGEEKMKVLVVAIPKKVSKDYLDFLSLMDLQPIRLENEAFSLTRALVDSKKLSGVTLILDMGFSSTKMVLASMGAIYAIHTVPLAGMAFTRLLSESFSINLEQAEQYKIAYGVDSSAAEGRIYKALTPLLQEMVTEIRKLILSWMGMGSENKVDRLILAGGGAKMKGFASYLVEQTNLDVLTANPIEGFATKLAMSEVTIFTGATGLAIE